MTREALTGHLPGTDSAFGSKHFTSYGLSKCPLFSGNTYTLRTTSDEIFSDQPPARNGKGWRPPRGAHAALLLT